MVPQGWSVGRIGSIEIKINVSLAFIALFVTYSLGARILPEISPHNNPLFYWVTGLAASAVFIGSVLWHELAHSVVAIRYGIPVVQIVLYLFGGVAQIARDPERPGQEFWIAIAGPASSMMLAILFGLMAKVGGVIGGAFAWLSLVNVALALFNLLPGFPLDGGRVLRAFLWRLGGSYRQATRQASRVGQAMAALFTLGGLALIFRGEAFNGIWFLLIAAFVFSAATSALRAAKGASLSMQTPVRRVMRFDVPLVEPSWPLAILAWRYLDHARDQAFPVVVGNDLVGLVSATEVDKIPRLEWGKVRVEQTMLPRDRLCLVNADDDLQSALNALEAKGMNHAPVYEAGQLVGMLNRRDIVYRT